MKTIFLLFYLSFSYTVAFSQTTIDSALYKKIEVMYKEDQKWRVESDKLYNKKKSVYDQATVDRKWAQTDSFNYAEAKRMIKKYGFPGYSLVGKSGSNKFFTIVQHCDDDVKFQQNVLTLMITEVNRHNASCEDYAYLKDRVLINQGKKQLYGTQCRYNPKTQKLSPLPTQDSLNLNKRRKEIGLPELSQYLKEMEKMEH
ncbi:DUF6624 domain-containing protein [Pedobacter cryoconitis]|uniref:Uncharacterized protein n=1 Tax=Pedobacter cryoconitis TaxID=188932 RepID=A0A7X0J4G0_9SPHI|nr:DUF6624 domain-containing protein [Pedobacter cryoconitis]MBB6500685.1 hypothetical protein [Pedobacter cryoconitis]